MSEATSDVRSGDGFLAGSGDDVAALAALANDTRYALLRRIVADQGDDGVCVCELEGIVPVSQSAVSQALGRLHDAGLVDRRKHGTWRYYESTDRASAILTALDRTRSHE